MRTDGSRARPKIRRRYFRVTEVGFLQTDTKERLALMPRLNFSDLLKIMVGYGLKFAGCDAMGKDPEILRYIRFEGYWKKGMR